MRKKILLASLMKRMSPPKWLERLGVEPEDRLRVLAYHRVLDMDPNQFAFDEEIVSASTAQFEEQVKYLSRHFVPMTFHGVLNYLRRKEPLPRRSVIVTFDDGYEDNYTCAFPILKQYGVPATMYVATNYVGNGGVFWFEELAYWFKRTHQTELCLKTLPVPAFSLSTTERSRSLARLRHDLMFVDNETRLHALEEIKEHLDVEISPSDRSWATTLNWEQVKEMSRAGFEVGSHTLSHPVLSRLSATELKKELTASKQEIESKTGSNVVSIAYPFGDRRVFNEAVKKAAAEAGYAFGVSYLQGINDLGLMDPFEVKRIHVETATTMDLFKCELLFPKVFVK